MWSPALSPDPPPFRPPPVAPPAPPALPPGPPLSPAPAAPPMAPPPANTPPLSFPADAFMVGRSTLILAGVSFGTLVVCCVALCCALIVCVRRKRAADFRRRGNCRGRSLYSQGSDLGSSFSHELSGANSVTDSSSARPSYLPDALPSVNTSALGVAGRDSVPLQRPFHPCPAGCSTSYSCSTIVEASSVTEASSIPTPRNSRTTVQRL